MCAVLATILIILTSYVTSTYAAPTLTLNVSPNPAILGQSITFSGQGANSGDLIEIDVLAGTSCSIPFGAIASGTAQPSGQYAVIVPTSTIGGVGTYSAHAYDLNTQTLTACVLFSIDPTTAVGGVVLPGVGFTVLLPWIIVLSLLGVVSVEAVVAKRRARGAPNER